mgnify:CR=1 FL=1
MLDMAQVSTLKIGDKMSKKRMVVVEGIRTAIGKFGGSLRDVNAEHLLAYCFRHVVKKSGIDPAQIDEVVVGNICQPVGNIARVAALIAKVPYSVPASTVSRNCASGIDAITKACQAAAAGDGEIFLVGGTENMSQVPYIMKDARFGMKMQHHIVTDGLWEGLFDPFAKQMMGRTAENIVQKWGITREEQDEYAIRSHQKAIEAQIGHMFDAQILPIKVLNRMRIKHSDGSNDTLVPQYQINFSQDESPRKKLIEEPASAGTFPAMFMHDSILDPIETDKFIEKDKTYVIERTVWDEGTVTAVNSCPINDGAAAILLMTEEKAVSLGLTPLAQVVSYGYTGCDPKLMGEGPITAVPKALNKAGLKMNDIDIFELNEAFAAQAIVCLRGLGLPSEKVNVWGGAIALGHAVGATGMSLTVKAMHILKVMKKRRAAITMCVGGGQGGCLIIEGV